jgi:lactate dehydrogenase-like 2-hydroxyacid dehydrogenase
MVRYRESPVNTQQVTNLINQPIRVGVLGYGGLGQAAARVLAPKGEMLWVAAAD